MWSNTKLSLVLLGGIVVAVLILGGFYIWLNSGPREIGGKINLVIEGVPPMTIYNHTGDNSYIVTDLAAAIASILRFYGEDLSIEELRMINARFYDDENRSALHQIEDIKILAEELGYNAAIEVPQSVDDFRKYFSGARPTPVIFSHFMEIGQNPDIQFKPMGVLIGMLDDEQSVVVHDYYFGYNKKLSYREFGQLGAYPAQILIITPKIPRTVRRSDEQKYARTDSMNRAEPIINKITIGRVAQAQKKYKIAAEYYYAALTNPDFDEVVPTYYKVVALNGGANSHIRLANDYEAAYELAVATEKINYNLDESFGDFWPGFVDGTNLVTDQFAGIHYWLGRIYEHQKEYGKALASYKRALEIYPYGPSKAALEKLQAR